MDQKRIDRISELTRISRTRALTQDELDERAQLRAEYIAAVKASLVSQLENTYIVEKDGTRHKVTRRD